MTPENWRQFCPACVFMDTKPIFAHALAKSIARLRVNRARMFMIDFWSINYIML